MKFSALVTAALLSPVTAEVFFKEDFNDDVRSSILLAGAYGLLNNRH
jgi:hypothetical protein